MKLILSLILVLIAAGATIAGALMHGNVSHRWADDSSVQSITTAIEQMPSTIGDWEQTSSSELGENAQDLLQCFGDEIRVYQNRQTGQSIQVALLFGPAGPISVHTPDICYSSREYKKLEERKRMQPEQQFANDSFWVSDFQSRELSGEALRAIYGWSTDGHWESPDSSRFKYAGQPSLFKIEFAARGNSMEELEADESVMDFVAQYSKAFRQQLQAVSSNP